MMGMCFSAGSPLMRRVASVAIEKRELNVHEDRIGMVRRSGGDRLLAVADLDDVKSAMDEKMAEDLPVVLLVLDHKNAFGHAFPTCCSTLTGTFMKNVEPQPGGLDPNSAAMHGDDTLGNRQAEPRPALRLGGGVVSLLEILENFGLICGVDAGSGVAHRERISPIAGSGLDHHLGSSP